MEEVSEFKIPHHDICFSKKRPTKKEVTILRTLADWNDIENHETLPVRQLCKALDDKVEEQAQERSAKIDKCLGSTISLEEITNIPAPFFFSYEHNGKVYCDNVLDLHEHLRQDKNLQDPDTYKARDPFTRTTLPQSVVDAITLKYYQVVAAIDWNDEPVRRSDWHPPSERQAENVSIVNEVNRNRSASPEPQRRNRINAAPNVRRERRRTRMSRADAEIVAQGQARERETEVAHPPMRVQDGRTGEEYTVYWDRENTDPRAIEMYDIFNRTLN